MIIYKTVYLRQLIKVFHQCPRLLARFCVKNSQTFIQTQQNNSTQKIDTASYNQTVKLNSILPKSQQGYAYGHYFPKEWSQHQIRKTLDPTLKQVQQVKMVKTKVGQNSNKVLIKFKNDQTRQKYIHKYNQDFLMTDNQSQKIVILPFQLKTVKQKKQAKKELNFQNPVRISNIDYDITKQQLQKLANDYGQLSHIQINLRKSGINKGFATIYFKQKQSAFQFVKFIDGLLYRDRKLKAHIIQKKTNINIQQQFIKVPTFIFKSNIDLMARQKSKQYDHK